MFKSIKKAQTIVLLNLIFLIISCEIKDESARLFPKVSTLEVIDITENGVVFGGLIEGFPLADIVDYGFVYGVEGSYKTKVSLGAYKGSDGRFTYQANKNLISGKSYILNAYAQTKSQLVLGLDTKFISLGGLAPVIKSFNPLSAGWGDTISISGNYFSTIAYNNKVKFNSEEAILVHTTDTLLKVLVPSTLNSALSTLSVTSCEKTATVVKQFEIAKPLILNMSDSVSYGGILSVAVKNIKASLCSFSIDDNTITTNQTNDTKLTFTIPKTYGYGSHKLKILLFGNSVEKQFFYKAPSVISVSPKLVAWGNTLNIVGRNFTAIPANSTIVFVANTCATYSFKIINDTLIQVPVPDCIKTSTFSISLNTPNLVLTPTAAATIQIKSPELLSFDKTEVVIGESITAFGRSIGNADLIGYIDNVQITPSFRDSTHFQFTTPDNLDVGKHSFRMTLNNIGSNTLEFTVKKLILTSFKDKLFCRTGKVTIYGQNLGKTYYNSVWFDNVQADYVSSDDNSITVKVSDDPTNQISDSPVVTVRTGLQNAFVPDKITLVEPWEKISEFYTGTDSGAKFTIGNDFYFSTGNSNNGEFYCYHSTSNSWQRIADYPGGRVVKPVCFILEDKAYVGMGTMAEPQKFWCYDPKINQWSGIASCPLTYYPSNFGFGVNQTGYVGSVNGNIYCYSVLNNNWVLGNLPANLSYSYSKNTGFGYQSRGFLVLGDYAAIYEFDQSTNHWSWLSYKPMNAVSLLIKSDANAVCYDHVKNVIYINANEYYNWVPAKIFYWDFSLNNFYVLFHTISSQNISLYTANDGGLFLMANDNTGSKLLMYKFNFDKYEFIKSQLDDY